MRSRASYQGHPIHPAIIPFPFAFLNGAWFFHAVGWLFDWPTWWTTGGHLPIAGIVFALAAAVPGVIDYVYTVPPQSTGKQRATRHMLINLSAVALVVIASIVRYGAADAPSLAVVLLETVSVGLLAVGTYMGGTLVTRNQVSVDHRYAEAGKWKEAEINLRPGTALTVARSDELKVNQMKLIRAGDKRIVLARTDDGFVAFDDRCTHRGGSLAGGVMICGTVQCPWHGSQFDAATGKVKAGPAEEGIRVYKVAEKDGLVSLTIE